MFAVVTPALIVDSFAERVESFPTRNKIGYDDLLDVFSVFRIGSIIGMFALGFLGVRYARGASGGMHQFLIQLIAILR